MVIQRDINRQDRVFREDKIFRRYTEDFRREKTQLWVDGWMETIERLMSDIKLS